MKQIINNSIKKISQYIPIDLAINTTNPILLYHSVFENVPNSLKGNVDNVTKEILYQQLSWLKKYFKILPIDEYLDVKNKKGLACITFDDAYKSVIENGLPIFEDLNIPISIFVNTSTLENKIFWRDKVRFIISENLVSELEIFSSKIKKFDNISFYKYSKMPINNSIVVEEEINKFLNYKGLDVQYENYCIDQEDQFIKHKLVSYGNHTHNHYVMSSLSDEDQYYQINNTKEILGRLDINLSNVFSLPFGGNEDYNFTTLQIVKDLGYDSMIMSRNRLNKNIKKNRMIYERFMPLNSNIGKRYKELALKSYLYK